METMPTDSAGLVRGSPRELLPTATACRDRVHFSIWLCCHGVPWPLALSPRSDLFKAPEMLLATETQGRRFLGPVYHPGGRAPSWSPEGCPFSPASPILAGHPQHCGGWRPSCGCREVMLCTSQESLILP